VRTSWPRRASPSRANGAPTRGAVAVCRTVWLPCVHLINCRPGRLACPDTPPAAGRAWVPDCRARTFIRSVTPSYAESAPHPRPMCDQFVILIGGRVHIPLTVRSGGAAPGGSARATPQARPHSPVIALREIFGRPKLSAETSVQNDPIYVVIPLRVDRAICGMPAALRISFLERNRPTPPGPDRVVPLALPPGEGDH
jgi:hypothetical protein